MDFNHWLTNEEKRKIAIRKPLRLLGKKVSVAHSDIDLWLKSVDVLAKDLSDLKDAKEKAKAKMNKISKSTDKEKVKNIEPLDSEEPDQDIKEKPVDRNDKKRNSQSDKKVDLEKAI